MVIVVNGVDMSGFRERRMKDRAYVRSARIRIGIGQESSAGKHEQAKESTILW